MATYTSNYGWTKPSGSDNVDISVLNDNLDDQDSVIHNAFLNMAVPFSELSTYAVDDIVLYDTGLYKCHTAVVTPGSWTGSTNWQTYKLSEGGGGGLTLGETSSTAYRGDRGKTAYDHSQSTGNPHGTTASDVGLGNVPNVATNDQEPTFTEASTRNNIASGEKLSVIFGKIQKFFNDLKSVAYSGSYTDLTNTPSLATVATSGSYADLSNKPQINGVTLSGNKTTSDLGLQGALTFDNVPTDGSNNPVKSDGIYDALASKPDKTATATGETLSLVPTSEGKALIHTVYGMSVQDGTPTPSSPVDIESAKADFRSVGKNLIPYPYYEGGSQTYDTATFTLNSDGSVTVNTSSATTRNVNYWLARPNVNFKYTTGRYFIKGTGSPNVSVAVVRYLGNTWVSQVNAYENDAYIDLDTSDPTYDNAWISVSIPKGKSVNNVTVYPLVGLWGISDTYEPYTKHDTTTDLTLRAIEVTSSDAYNLVRDGKYYIADTLDYSEDNGFVVTKRIEYIDIDGTETGWLFDAEGTTKQRFSLPNFYQVKEVGLPVDALNCSISNEFTNTSNAGGAWGTYCFGGTNPSYRYIVFNDGGSTHQFNSLSDFTTWLTNNPTYIDYILATPTTESITTEQALALLGLKTYDESTTISSQAEPSCTIAVEYAKERLGALALTAYNTAKGNDLRITALEA